MNKKINQNSNVKSSKGFTLVEVMVSVGIFALVVLVAMTAVLSVVDANKKAQSLDDVINNMNFTIESMVRDLRTGYGYSCTGSPACNSITFTSSVSNAQVTYSLNGAVINKQVGSATVQPLTSGNITVKRFDLYPTIPNAGTGQPRILMILQATAKVGNQSTEFDLQTWISQRRRNI